MLHESSLSTEFVGLLGHYSHGQFPAGRLNNGEARERLARSQSRGAPSVQP